MFARMSVAIDYGKTMEQYGSASDSLHLLALSVPKPVVTDLSDRELVDYSVVLHRYRNPSQVAHRPVCFLCRTYDKLHH